MYKYLTLTGLMLTAAPLMADSPNNYIYTDDSGVIYEIDRGGVDYDSTNREVITRDMATQQELDDAIRPQGLSLTTALTSFEGSGVGVGISYDFDGYSEVSIGLGGNVTQRTRVIGGVTHNSFGSTTASIGIGLGF